MVLAQTRRLREIPLQRQRLLPAPTLFPTLLLCYDVDALDKQQSAVTFTSPSERNFLYAIFNTTPIALKLGKSILQPDCLRVGL